MTEKDMTVKELYEALEPLLDEYGDLEVRVGYDSGLVVTGIKKRTPQLMLQLMKGYSYILFEGY